MPDRTAIYKQAIRYFDSLDTNNQAVLREKREILYKAVPRIEEIDREISLTGIKTAMLAIENDDSSAKIKEAEEKMSYLKAEKLNLMEESGFGKDYLEIKYKCSKCKDKGFIDGSPCTCFNQKLVELSYNSSSIEQNDESFETFDIELYSDEYCEAEGISPRENMEINYSICRDFAENFGYKKESMLFYGNTGLGKTFMCSAIAKEIIKKGYTVMYNTASQLFKAIEKERFSRKDDDEYRELSISDDILGVDLLIIDDLGTEFGTIVTSSELFDIINIRLIEHKPVIISTNLSPDRLQDQYSDRISSRIIGEYKCLKFFGDDIRIIKRYRNF